MAKDIDGLTLILQYSRRALTNIYKYFPILFRVCGEICGCKQFRSVNDTVYHYFMIHGPTHVEVQYIEDILVSQHFILLSKSYWVSMTNRNLIRLMSLTTLSQVPLSKKIELSLRISPRNRIHIQTCFNMSIRGPNGKWVSFAKKLERKYLVLLSP